VLDLRSNCGICGGFPPLINNVTIYYSGTNLDTTCNAFNCAVPFFGNLLMAVGIVMAALLMCMVQQQVRRRGCLARAHCGMGAWLMKAALLPRLSAPRPCVPTARGRLDPARPARRCAPAGGGARRACSACRPAAARPAPRPCPGPYL
jgi:hypothetical protein